MAVISITCCIPLVNNVFVCSTSRLSDRLLHLLGLDHNKHQLNSTDVNIVSIRMQPITSKYMTPGGVERHSQELYLHY